MTGEPIPRAMVSLGGFDVTVQPLKSCIKRKSEESCIWAWPFETKPGKLDV
jgi:hypothetical protein